MALTIDTIHISPVFTKCSIYVCDKCDTSTDKRSTVGEKGISTRKMNNEGNKKRSHVDVPEEVDVKGGAKTMKYTHTRSDSDCSSVSSTQNAYNHKHRNPLFTTSKPTEIILSDNEHYDAEDDEDEILNDEYDPIVQDSKVSASNVPVSDIEKTNDAIVPNQRTVYELIHTFQSTCQHCGNTVNVLDECPLQASSVNISQPQEPSTATSTTTTPTTTTSSVLTADNTKTTTYINNKDQISSSVSINVDKESSNIDNPSNTEPATIATIPIDMGNVFETTSQPDSDMTTTLTLNDENKHNTNATTPTPTPTPTMSNNTNNNNNVNPNGNVENTEVTLTTELSMTEHTNHSNPVLPTPSLVTNTTTTIPTTTPSPPSTGPVNPLSNPDLNVSPISPITITDNINSVPLTPLRTRRRKPQIQPLPPFVNEFDIPIGNGDESS